MTTAGAATDPGLQRTVNEDRIYADSARGVFLVVDGLGGHAAGERSQAFRAYQRFAERLRKELDAEPEEETTELLEALQRAE